MNAEPRYRGKASKTLALEAAILDVLATFEGSMSGRQVFYQCVSRGACENHKADTKRVLSALVDMRRDGRVPYDRIVDRTRAKHQIGGWDSAEALLDACASQFRRDKWKDQEVIPMIACEKAALEGIFAEACDEYGVSLWTLRGYNSESFEYEWAQHIRALNGAGKNVVVYYFGDHDPSGLGIEANSRDKLRGFGADFTWRRAGLRFEDFSKFNLVHIPIKPGDPRAKQYRVKFGHNPPAAELDALNPDELRRRIRASIVPWINVEAWERVQRDEDLQREDLALVRANWNACLLGLRSEP